MIGRVLRMNFFHNERLTRWLSISRRDNVKIKSLKNKRNAMSTTRLVHRSGWVGFRLNLGPTRSHWVEGGGTRNWPPTSTCQIGFGLRWTLINLVCGGGCRILLKLTKFHQKLLKLVGLWSNLTVFLEFGQDLTKFDRDLTKFGEISPNRILILSEFLCINRVEWLEYWIRKPITRPTRIGSWRWRHAANRLEF